MICHMHQPNIFLNSMLGYTMNDYESDADRMFPAKQIYPEEDQDAFVEKITRNPEAAVARGNALLRAEYSPSLDALRALAADYGVDYLLLERGALSRESLSDLGWVKPFPATAEMLAALDDGSTPALAAEVDRCTVFQREKLVVVDVACVLNAA